MLNDLLIWAAMLFALVFLALDKRRRVGAMTLAYFLILSLGHVPGLLAYLDPNTSRDAEETKIGFYLTQIGMTAFIAGAIAARILRLSHTSAKDQSIAHADIFHRLGLRVLTMGI